VESHGDDDDSILKGSDDGVLYLIKPRFWTLSIVTPVTMDKVQKRGFIKDDDDTGWG
jgi:hypothetical protein